MQKAEKYVKRSRVRFYTTQIFSRCMLQYLEGSNLLTRAEEVFKQALEISPNSKEIKKQLL